MALQNHLPEAAQRSGIWEMLLQENDQQREGSSAREVPVIKSVIINNLSSGQVFNFPSARCIQILYLKIKQNLCNEGWLDAFPIDVH